MSWSNESDYQSQIKVGNETQWKMALAKIDTSLKTIKRQYDDLKARFDYIKQNKMDIKEIEVKRQNLNSLISEITNQIAQLETMVPSTPNTATTAMKNQVKSIRRRAADITVSVQQLCASINEELYNRQMARKKESSIISHELGYNDHTSKYSNQMQMSVLEDAQLQQAEEEQKQAEKIARDIVTLESIFVRLSAMVHEQGEAVERIEANVEDAYTNVEAGEKELGQAVVYKRSAMKKKLCIIGIVLAVLVVIAIIIVLSVVLNK